MNVFQNFLTYSTFFYLDKNSRVSDIFVARFYIKITKFVGD